MSLKGVNDFSHEDYKEMRFLVEETKKGNKDAAAKLYKFVEVEMITPSAYERLINEYADVVYVKEKKNYKPLILILLIIFAVCFVFVFNAYAHKGKTDSNGGHRDNNNVSGLGSYHFHCGGYPAHLHTNGCPYTSSSNYNTSTAQEEVGGYSDEYGAEYDYGYEDGYDMGYETGYDEGYNDGYYEEQDEYQQLYEENENLIKKNDKLKEENSNSTVFIIVLIIIILILFFNRKKNKHHTP